MKRKTQPLRATHTQLSGPTKRININILESQYKELTDRGLNVSRLVRDLLDAHLSATTITIHTDGETRRLFDTVIAHTGHSDGEVAAELRQVLQRLLEDKLETLTDLKRELQDD